jgi:NAD(P)H dehydrogenase (quinone)
MKHLVVYSHPYPKSFNHAIMETYTNQLRAKEHEVKVRDLYAINFDPVLKASELKGFQKGQYPKDIKEEQKHVLWAELITFICPIWWGGLTSNLRGYMDRVLSLGFAYKYTEQGPQGMLRGKKIFFINTLGDSAERYEKEGYSRSMNQLLDEIAFQFCGMEVLGHKYFGSVGTVTDQDRKAMLDEVKRIADRIV